MSALLKGVEDGFGWVCPILFGSNDDNLRNSLWEELSREAKMDMAWCVSGEFIVIRYPI